MRHSVEAEFWLMPTAYLADSDGFDARTLQILRTILPANKDLMGHLSADAPVITRNNAEQWHDWAMGVADGIARTVPAEV